MKYSSLRFLLIVLLFSFNKEEKKINQKKELKESQYSFFDTKPFKVYETPYTYSYKTKLTKSQINFVLSLYDSGYVICEKYNVSPVLMITQAISEQGYEIHSNYRIFNITGKGETVYDKQMKKYVTHRTYNSLNDAIEDYCKVITNDYYKINNQPIDTQIYMIGKSKYATSKNYHERMLQISNKVRYILTINDRKF